MIRFTCVAVLVLWPCVAVAQDANSPSAGRQDETKTPDANKEDLKKAWAEARALLAKAKRVRNPSEQPVAMEAAIKQFEACLKLDSADDNEKHRVIREAGSAHFELAEVYWPRSAWNGPLGKGTPGSSRVTKAREHFSRAHELFAQAAAYWRGKVGELPSDREEARKKVLAVGLGFVELGAAEYDGAHCRAAIARALPADDEKRKEAVQAAVKEYQRVWKTYSIAALGQYSGLSAASMLEYIGDVAAAIEINEAVYTALVEGLLASQATVDDLQGRVIDQLMSCWNDDKVREYAKAIEAGEAWLGGEDFGRWRCSDLGAASSQRAGDGVLSALGNGGER